MLAEQDIAIEEFCPFNCRLLYCLLLATPRRLRSGLDYPLYKQLIKHMWPEALALPFNPPPTTTRLITTLKGRVRPYVPDWVMAIIKQKVAN